jgi:type VI secretion system protein ImpK
MGLSNHQLHATRVAGNDAPAAVSADASGADGVAALIDNLSLAQATESARVGRYTEAESILSSLFASGESSAALDLLARIRVQQGRLLEGEALWQQATRLDPGNEAYRSGLRRIARSQKQSIWLRGAFPLLIPLTIVLAVVAVVYMAKSYADDLRASIAAGQSRQPFVEANKSKETSVPAPVGEAQRELPEIKADISGTNVKRQDQHVEISFDQPLFSRGDRLTTEAKERLTGLGRQLMPQAGRISVEIIGHTNNVPIPAGHSIQDNAALGMNRARAVADHMSNTALLPYRMLSLRSAADEETPYPNDTQANRLRNRTVVIRITPTR